MMARELTALVWSIDSGRVRQDRRSGRLGFTYDESWRRRADSVPLSLSIPSGESGSARSRIARRKAKNPDIGSFTRLRGRASKVAILLLALRSAPHSSLMAEPCVYRLPMTTSA